MIKADLMRLVGKKVFVYFKDGEKGIYGTLGYADEFSEKHDYRKPNYFYIGNTSFNISHVRKVAESEKDIRTEIENIKNDPLFNKVSNDVVLEVVLTIIDKYLEKEERNMMSDIEFTEKAKSEVQKYVEEHLDCTDKAPVFDVYTVWICKTLKNWKTLISTSIPDGMYYEVTYNGENGEMYLDAYKKWENRVIRL